MKILILGGYGNFGKRICQGLFNESSVSLVVAGRNLKKAQAFSAQYQNISACCIDIYAPDLAAQISLVAPDLVIHTAGPFQGQDYTVANACIEAGVHYLDLADGRAFVSGIGKLDAAARKAGVLVISGASTIPALSSVVIDKLRSEFSTLDEIYYAIAPGYRAERGNATITGILSYVGLPFKVWQDGQWMTVYGYQDVHRYDFKNELGRRWLARVDIPDLELFPQRYPGIKTVRFYAGLELSLLHWMLWLMSWLPRLGLLQSWSRYSMWILAVSHLFDRCGSDAGGMFIELNGMQQGKHKRVTWILTALNGHGPYVPTIAAILLAKKMAQGFSFPSGAMPCLGMFTLEEFTSELTRYDITQEIRRSA